MKGDKIKGICIKSYQDEDDLYDYDLGRIDHEDIKVYNVGEEDFIIEGFFSPEYWEIKED